MLRQFLFWLHSLGVSEEGQGLVEYALILVLIAIVVLIALSAIGTNINLIFQQIGETLGIGEGG